MRAIVLSVACVLVLAACSKKPAQDAKAVAPAAAPAGAQAAAAPAAPAPSGAPVSGEYTINGKAAALTQVTAHTGDPFDGEPITLLVFTANDQAGDAKADFDAVFRKFGDAIVIKATPKGDVVGADIVHSGLKNPNASVSLSGVLSLKDFKSEGGQISGRLTSGGPQDVFGDQLNVDLAFHTKAP
jgi:hypothetical protein